MDNSIQSIKSVLTFNTQLFVKSIREITEENAIYRLSPNTNNVSFIALHVIDARYYLSKYLGVELDNPFNKYQDVKTIDDVMVFPHIDTMLIHWNDVSNRVIERFETLSREELMEKSPQIFPIDDDSKFGGVHFLVHHETYHIGQLAYLRKYLGYTAISFN